jgi:hypothetical protein
MRALMGPIKDRRGTFYARRRVPERLQEAVARVLNSGRGRQVFLKKSLGTKSLKAANIAATHVLADFDRTLADGLSPVGNKMPPAGPSGRQGNAPRSRHLSHSKSGEIGLNFCSCGSLTVQSIGSDVDFVPDPAEGVRTRMTAPYLALTATRFASRLNASDPTTQTMMESKAELCWKKQRLIKRICGLLATTQTRHS